jgi:plasmid stability protein
MHSLQNAGMPAITIRDVPDDARNELAARAARSGRSLQEYLRAELIALAERPSAEDLLARVRARKLHAGASLTDGDVLEAVVGDRR